MDSKEDSPIEHKDDHVDSMEDSTEERPESSIVTRYYLYPSDWTLKNGVLIPGKGYEFKSRPEDEEVPQDKENKEESLEGTSARSDEPEDTTAIVPPSKPSAKRSLQSANGRKCFNCQATKTNKWRKNERGPICHTCYSYRRRHKKNRPLSLIKYAISKRQRKSKKATASGEGTSARSDEPSEITGDEIQREIENEEASLEDTTAVVPSFSVVKTPKRPYQKVKGRKCSNCGTEKTTGWHRAIGSYLCNACGQFLKVHRTHRPLVRQKKYDGAVCINCQAKETSQWRTNERGPICKACHNYLERHKVDRPLSMKKETIHRRKSKSKKVTAPGEPLEEESETGMTSDTMSEDAVTVESDSSDIDVIN